jgi:hypothetical protein
MWRSIISIAAGIVLAWIVIIVLSMLLPGVSAP